MQIITFLLTFLNSSAFKKVYDLFSTLDMYNLSLFVIFLLSGSKVIIMLKKKKKKKRETSPRSWLQDLKGVKLVKIGTNRKEYFGDTHSDTYTYSTTFWWIMEKMVHVWNLGTITRAYEQHASSQTHSYGNGPWYQQTRKTKEEMGRWYHCWQHLPQGL